MQGDVPQAFQRGQEHLPEARHVFRAPHIRHPAEHGVVAFQLDSPHDSPAANVLRAVVDVLWRQIRQMFLLGAAQHEVADGAAQLPAQIRAEAAPLRLLRRIRRRDVAAAEILIGGEQPWQDGVVDGPEVREGVLHGRAGDGQAEIGLEALGCAGLQGVGVPDILRLVEDHASPVRHAEGELVVAQGVVVGEHQPARLVQAILAELLPHPERAADAGRRVPAGTDGRAEGGLAPGAGEAEAGQIRLGLEDDDVMEGRPVEGRLHLPHPVLQQDDGHHRQDGLEASGGAHAAHLHVQGREHGEGLAQAHVVRQQAAGAHGRRRAAAGLRHEAQDPARALPLVLVERSPQILLVQIARVGGGSHVRGRRGVRRLRHVLLVVQVDLDGEPGRFLRALRSFHDPPPGARPSAWRS